MSQTIINPVVGIEGAPLSEGEIPPCAATVRRGDGYLPDLKRQLARLRGRGAGLRRGMIARCLDYRVRINDGPNFYNLVKDIFVQRIYHFEAARPDPLVLDCGSNIGMSILYFKHVYPQARVVGFEPDPRVFRLLEENVSRHRLAGVRLVQAGLSARAGDVTLASDGRYASCLDAYGREGEQGRDASFTVPCVRLWDYLAEPVDFLKMNIEGAEWDVLADSEDRLRSVREIVVEYHHLPGLPRTLHQILELLHRQGFEYLVNSFDAHTNPGACPPFRLTPKSSYYLLIYARRLD